MSVAAKPARKLPVIWLVRVGVSAVVLALIFYFVPFKQVWATARALSPALWLGALALFLLGHAAAAAKWRLLIGPGIGFAAAFLWYGMEFVDFAWFRISELAELPLWLIHLAWPILGFSWLLFGGLKFYDDLKTLFGGEAP
jgi:hypothetical protein